MFNDPEEHEFLLVAHVTSVEEKDLIPQGADRSALTKFQAATFDHSIDYNKVETDTVAIHRWR